MILITGFEPFDEYKTNPSWDIARELSLELPQVGSLLLPVSFNQCFQKLEKSIQTLSPKAVICLGLADTRERVTVERIAINIAHARITDNDGEQPLERPIHPKGNDGIFSSLALQELTSQIPGIEVSNTAGTYVCNYLMYQLLYHYQNKFPCGFVHVPATPEMMPAGPNLPLEQSLDIVRQIAQILS